MKALTSLILAGDERCQTFILHRIPVLYLIMVLKYIKRWKFGMKSIRKFGYQGIIALKSRILLTLLHLDPLMPLYIFDIWFPETFKKLSKILNRISSIDLISYQHQRNFFVHDGLGWQFIGGIYQMNDDTLGKILD